MFLRNTPEKKPLKSQKGFTLLEIIAVIVIMSILAVVAVPKYFDLQEKAKEKAFGAGVSEAVGRLNGYFAEQVLSGVKPASIVYNDQNLGTNLGDFWLEVSDGAAEIQIIVHGRNATPMEGLQTTLTIKRPGL